MTECEKQVVWKWGEVRVSRAVKEVTAEPVVGPQRGNTTALATPLSSTDVYFVSSCLQGHQVPSARYRLKSGSVPFLVMPQAAPPLFCVARLACPLIVTHPSHVRVYKMEITRSIIWAQRQCDGCLSCRIPSFPYPSQCFRSEKWALSSAMIRFSLHISIEKSFWSGWYTIPTRRQQSAEGLWKSNTIRPLLVRSTCYSWSGPATHLI